MPAGAGRLSVYRLTCGPRDALLPAPEPAPSTTPDLAHPQRAATPAGDFCLELAKLGDYQITGLDISQTFVEIAQKNAAKAGLPIDFRLGDAAHMPFEPDSFDFMFCQAAFKNFSQPLEAIAEMYRVLRPQGQAVIVDLRRDASQAEIERYVHTSGMGRIKAWFTIWTFKHMLLKRAYSVNEMQAFVAKTPFGSGQIDTDEISFQVWLVKDPLH